MGMADYSTVPPPSSGSAGGGGGGGVNDAFKDALQRARQVSVQRGGFPESLRRARPRPLWLPGLSRRQPSVPGSQALEAELGSGPG